jgi:hypothetical protein
MKLLLIGIIFCFHSSISYSQHADINGVWYFNRFGGPHGEISDDPEIIKANKINKGLMITFTGDNKMISKLPGNSANSTVVKYQVFYDRKEVIIDGVTMKIMLLTSDILELYPKDESRPALFLKRNKDSKTAMSSP